MANIVHAIRLVADAKKAMDDIRLYQDQIVATAQTVKKHEATLNGDRILKAAHNWTAAVARLGGATKDAASAEQMLAGVAKLSVKEKQRLNATLQEAVEKYRLLGKEAPTAMRELEKATRTATDAAAPMPGKVDAIGGSLKSMAGLVGIAFSAGAVKTWVTSTLAAAGQINDLSEKLGVSAEAVQRWKYAADQGGATIDTVGSAVAKMNDVLAEGDKSTIKSLRSAGLSFEHIRQMRPEDAFNTITAAIKGIEDPMMRAKIAQDLFGKSGTELLPAIVAGIQEVGAETTVMVDDTVTRLADAEDAWASLGSTAMIWSAEMMSGAMASVDQATSSWGNFFKVLASGPAAGFLGAIPGSGLSSPPPSAPKPSGPTPEERARAIRDAIAQARADAEAAAASLKAAAAQRQHAEAIRKLADAWTGATAIRAAKDVIEGVTDAAKRGVPIHKMSEAHQREINKVVGEGIDAYRRIGQTAPQSMRLVWLATLEGMPAVQGLGTGVKELGQQVDVTKLALQKLRTEIPNVIQGFEGMGAKLPGLKVDIADLLPDVQKEAIEKAKARALQLKDDMKAMGLQFANNMALAFADGIRSGDWSQFENQLSDALSTAMAEGTAAAVDSVAPGLGQALKPLFKALSEQLLDVLGLGTAGRDVVKEFAASFGGFDELREKLQQSLDPATAERLWIALTQGVGSNNPQQAQAAIDAITSALAAQEATIARANAAAEKYGITLSQMGGEERMRRISAMAQGLYDDFEALTLQLGVSTADAIRGMSDEINAFITAALRAGEQIPPGMQPIIEQLITMGLLTEENARLMLGLSATAMPSLKDIEEAAARYGLTLDELGPKVQQLRIDEQAAQVVKDFELLTLAGADAGTVIAAMGPQINEMVNRARLAGVELPASMRKFVEEMARSGQLVDENGEKLTDLSGIKFAEPLTDKIDDLILALRDFIKEITEGAVPALRSLGTTRIPPVRVPYYYDQEGKDPVTGRTLPGYKTGTEGYEYFGSGTPVMLHGWEKVTPFGKEAPSPAAPAGGRMLAPVTIQMEGRAVWEGLIEVAHAEGLA